MEEKGHIYEIVVAEHQPKMFKYNEFELKFGPVLLENKMNVFIISGKRITSFRKDKTTT